MENKMKSRSFGPFSSLHSPFLFCLSLSSRHIFCPWNPFGLVWLGSFLFFYRFRIQIDLTAVQVCIHVPSTMQIHTVHTIKLVVRCQCGDPNSNFQSKSKSKERKREREDEKRILFLPRPIHFIQWPPHLSQYTEQNTY